MLLQRSHQIASSFSMLAEKYEEFRKMMDRDPAQHLDPILQQILKYRSSAWEKIWQTYEIGDSDPLFEEAFFPMKECNRKFSFELKKGTVLFEGQGKHEQITNLNEGETTTRKRPTSTSFHPNAAIDFAEPVLIVYLLETSLRAIPVFATGSDSSDHFADSEAEILLQPRIRIRVNKKHSMKEFQYRPLLRLQEIAKKNVQITFATMESLE